tara:strand:- start:1154 stop:1714 length:561 start_codon:yes stop_codon:yes gene_type:complete
MEANPVAELTPSVSQEKPLEINSEKNTTALKHNSNKLFSTSLAEDAALKDINQNKPTAALKTLKKATKMEIATLDSAETLRVPGDLIQILFSKGASVLPQSAHASLAAVATHLGQDETLRLQLKAYASGGADAASQARRLSLSRALSVRSELIEQGVRSTRIDVRALGNKSESKASDRVDIILVKR